MSLNLNKKSILKNTVKVGISTFLSRTLALTREILQVKFFGVGAMSDAFIMAFRIPNLFRHVFAEGAMSASFVPAIVQTVKEKKHREANGLITLSLIFFQSLILLLYLFVLFKTDLVVKMIAPGFSAEQAEYTVLFLRIMFPFLFLVSASALFAGALHAVNHFFIPAIGPAMWNFVYVSTLVICLKNNLSPMYLCWGVIIAGMVQTLAHVIMYFRCNFTFGAITQEVRDIFKRVMHKFLPCFLGVSIVEINLFVSGIVASFLPKGSVSLLYYGSRFMNLPLGIFAVAFSSILLPHFSRVVLYAPKRISFYMVEVAKFVTWVIIPVALFLMFTSERLFYALFLLRKGTVAHVGTAALILIIYSTGLLFFSINKVLMNIFYSLKDTTSTTKISAIGAIVNLVGDIIGMQIYGVYGIAAASSLAGCVMTILCLIFLYKKHDYKFYLGNYVNFLMRYTTQLFLILVTGRMLFFAADVLLQGALVNYGATLGGFWLMAFPSIGLLFASMYFSRHWFGLKVYFLK